MEQWTPANVKSVAEIASSCFPAEPLTDDELLACLWEGTDGEIVLGTDDASGAVAAVIREAPGRPPAAMLKFLAVAPGRRREGRASELLSAVESWARDAGAEAVVAGGAAPFYLWPGVDFDWTAAICLFEVAGYRPVGAEFNMTYPVSHRASVPAGFELRRAIEDTDAGRVLDMCGEHWPNWVAETGRAIEHATCLAVFDGDDRVVGFGCHSVNRIGWLGPMATDPQRRAGGVGNALLGAIATDLQAAGRSEVEVAWVGPATFYAKAAGAKVSRVFRVLRKRIS